MKKVGIAAKWLPLNWAVLLIVLCVAGAATFSATAAQPSANSKPSAPKPKAVAVPRSPVVQTAGPHKVAKGELSFLIDSVPSWTNAIPDGGKAPTDSQFYYAYVDEQTRLESNNVTQFRAIARVVERPAGLEQAANIQVQFDPQFQTLTLHKVEVIRGTERIDRLGKGEKVELLKRETRLESSIYDGRVTASMVLSDVRVGDRIEYSFTIRGQNPVFEGRYSEVAWSATQLGPTMNYRYRLIAPAGRNIAYKAGNDVMTNRVEKDGMVETVFRRLSVPKLEFDQTTPQSVFLNDQIQLTEYADWNDVAKWGRRLFEHEIKAGVKARASEIAAGAATPEGRVIAALDFMQKEIRYFGLEMGPNSHRPADPETVLQQRFGDCKDKASLLIGILQSMGIKAEPVLVSTYLRDSVDSHLPSPLAFDHVIVKVTLNEKTYWLDGTRLLQTGSLDGRGSVGLGKGLVLMMDTMDLATLPNVSNEERVSVIEEIRVNKLASSPVVRKKVTYSGELAELVRDAIANQSVDKIKSATIADFKRFYPNATLKGEFLVQDEAGRNAISLVQDYTLQDFWEFPNQQNLVGNLVTWNIANALNYKNTPDRKIPYRLDYPGIYRHSIIIDFDEDVFRSGGNGENFNVENINFSYRATATVVPRQLKFSAELRQMSDEVSTSRWTGYAQDVTKLRPQFFKTVTVAAIAPSQIDKMNQDLRMMETAIRGSKVEPKISTSLQADARMREIVLGAQLEGGRLNSKLRAQALLNRAMGFDNTGRPELASRDLQEAIQLDDGNADIYRAAAVNALIMGRDAAAIDFSKRASQAAPADSSFLSTRVHATYLSGEYGEAKLLAERALDELSGPASDYIALWFYLAAQRQGSGTEKIKERLFGGSTDRWPNQVLKLLAGALDLESVQRYARENPREQTGKLCELYFFLGEKSLIEGDRRKARDYFQRSIDTGVYEYLEHSIAKRRMTMLSAQ